MKNINIVIVDDRDIILDSMKLVLSGFKDIGEIAKASDGQEAIEMVKDEDYDVVLMDVNMPNMNGAEATKKILKVNPNIKVLANSFHFSPTNIKEMVRAGASGFILKGEDKEDYMTAIRTVFEGTIYLSDQISSQVYDKVSAYLKYPPKTDALVG